MSAAEISSLLVSYGNIRKPLAINKLSTILQKSGFEPRRTKTKRGYVVFVIKDLDEQRRLEARAATKIGDTGDAGDAVS